MKKCRGPHATRSVVNNIALDYQASVYYIQIITRRSGNISGGGFKRASFVTITELRIFKFEC